MNKIGLTSDAKAHRACSFRSIHSKSPIGSRADASRIRLVFQPLSRSANLLSVRQSTEPYGSTWVSTHHLQQSGLYPRCDAESRCSVVYRLSPAACFAVSLTLQLMTFWCAAQYTYGARSPCVHTGPRGAKESQALRPCSTLPCLYRKAVSRESGLEAWRNMNSW